MVKLHAAAHAVSANQAGFRSRSARAANPPVRQRKPMKPIIDVERHHTKAEEKNKATAAPAAICFSSVKALNSAYRPIRSSASRMNQRAPWDQRTLAKYGHDKGRIGRPQSRTGMS